MLRSRGIAHAVVAGVASLVFGSAAYADGMDGSLKDAPAPAKNVWSGFYMGFGGGAGKVDQSVDVKASKLTQIDKFKKVIDYKEIQKKKKVCSPVHYFPYFHCNWVEYTDYVPNGYHWEDNGSATYQKNKEETFGDDSWHGFGTIQFGADHLFRDRFLVGVFADVDIYQDADSTFSFKDCDLSIAGNLDVERVWNVGGRIGVLARPNLLIYGVGGYSQADVDGATVVDFKKGGPEFQLAPDHKLRGYFVGGGGEWQFRDNLALKVEYRYAKYDSEGDSASATKGPYVDYNHWDKSVTTKTYEASADYDVDIQSIRAALVLRFGREETPAPLK